ncbi:hypothetical protein QQS21_007361 [Conoideocrella luteorostrata]|uniref:Uncharacterized protein n=1 Tax=Conoideocrella luteorostrata TaxID=1105319 RepID=A0AAJ0FXF5_9HYPO|nr:hypothetical protein QQS21_007361 [Conoideocrella luteorostrata]
MHVMPVTDAKSGRPRFNSQQSKSPPVADDDDAYTITPPYRTVAGHGHAPRSERSSYRTFPITPEPQQDYRPQDVDQTLPSLLLTDDVHHLELQQHAAFSDSAGLSYSHHSFADVSSHDALFETTSPAPLSAEMPAALWSTDSASLQSPPDRGTSTEPQSQAFQGYAFFNLLQQCSKLQRHLLAAEDASAQSSDDGSAMVPSRGAEMPDSKMQEMLEDVEANYKLILDICEKGAALSRPFPGQTIGLSEKPPPPLLDPASISLITAVVFKALQVCSVLLGGAGLRARSIADVLLYKRLDVNITLARIVISKIEASAPNKVPLWQELSNKVGLIERQFADKREGIISGV